MLCTGIRAIVLPYKDKKYIINVIYTGRKCPVMPQFRIVYK